MNILFTICGREGSKEFKNKNLKEMRGVPLVIYTMAVIWEYVKKHREDHVTVALNTDSKPLTDMIKIQKVLPVRLITRSIELSGDTVPKVDVIRDTFLLCTDVNADVIIDLDITSPMRRVEDIENIIAEYNKGDYDLVFSVVEARRSPYFNMVELKEDGCFRKICKSSFTARQQAPRTYELNASIYAYKPSFLERKIDRTILDYQCGISVMPDFLILDIDSEEDYEMMQYLHSFYCERDIGLYSVYLTAWNMLNDSNEPR